MVVYNVNIGIGWASSGVEYAQAYRNKVLTKLGVKRKFIFTELILYENIQHMTANIGLKDEDVLSPYIYFTDFEIGPACKPYDDFKRQIVHGIREEIFHGSGYQLIFDEDAYAMVHLVKGTDVVHAVEYVSRGYLVRKDFYLQERWLSEYYAPKNNQAALYLRRFFNQDGTTAYEQAINESEQVYRVENQVLYGEEAFLDYFFKSLAFSADDAIIIDRGDQVNASLLQRKGQAKLGVVVHAEHFSEPDTDEDYILWNNYYEYMFNHASQYDFFLTSTDGQTDLLRKQFQRYTQHNPKIVTIPVGSVAQLRYPKGERSPYSLITASRLASEKHIDWLVQAVVEAKNILPDITFDIYGTGGEFGRLQQLIAEKNAQGYIHLMGHQHLEEVYQSYQLYVAASTSEGFGLTLLEAVAAGLPLVGFDVRYGNPTFIKEGENGYLLPYHPKT